MNDKIQLKRGTLANWLKADPVLADGEMALVATDASKPTVYDSKKVGDGTHKFSELEMLGYKCLQELGDSQQFPMSQKAITDWINKGYQFRGVATPSTNPGTPDGPVFYFAAEAGTYSNFNGISVAVEEVAILEWKGSWIKKTTGFATQQQVARLDEKIDNKTNEINVAKEEALQAIANLADDEDLTSVDDGTGSNVLKFANREYNPVNFSGKGYKILRKNIQDGKNILIQEMINDPNTVYEIRYDFDLDKKTINIPAGCIIFFNGGLIKNGTVNANYCYFRYLEYKCFDNIIIKNRILNKSLSAVAFGFGVDNNADVLNFMLKNVNVPTVTLPEGGYDIDKPIVVYSNKCLVGAGTGANIGSTILYPVGNWHTNYPNRGVIETFNFSWKSEDGGIPNYAHQNQIRNLVIKEKNENEPYDFGIVFWCAGEQALIYNCSVFRATYAGFFIGGSAAVQTLYMSSCWHTKGIEDGNLKHKGYGCMIGSHPNDNFAEGVTSAHGGNSASGTIRLLGLSGDSNNGGHIFIEGVPTVNIVGLKSEDHKDCIVISQRCFRNSSGKNNTAMISASGSANLTPGKSYAIRIVDNPAYADVSSPNGIAIFSTLSGTYYPLKDDVNDIELPAKTGIIQYNNFTDVSNNYSIGRVQYLPSKVYIGKYSDITEPTIRIYDTLQKGSKTVFEFRKKTDGYSHIELQGVVDRVLVGNNRGHLIIKNCTNDAILFHEDWKGDAYASNNRLSFNGLPPINGYKVVTDSRIYYWNSTKQRFITAKGYPFGAAESGTFSQKPTSDLGIDIGLPYFCTDRHTVEGSVDGIMIYYKGNDIWVDALGREVN